MKLIDRIKNRALRKALDHFIEEKEPIKMPNVKKINSAIIILEEYDKENVRNIESSMKSLFGTARCGFVILSNQMSDTILQSDLYTEVTPKDFGFMSVLKPEKYQEISKLPLCNVIINMASKHPDVSDYICTLPKTDFRISFFRSEHLKIYDLIIENRKGADSVSNIHVLHNYLEALVGDSTTN